MPKKKPPEKRLPSAKGTLFVVSSEGNIYLVDGDALRDYGHIDVRNEGLVAEGPAPEFLIAELKHKGEAHSDRIVARGTTKIGMIVELKPAESAPGIGPSRGVEQPVIDEMIDRAMEVIGSRDEAMRWLGTPVRALNFATPISVLGTKDGVEHVHDVLGQMEYGIW